MYLKEELKDGAVIKTRRGQLHILMNGFFINLETGARINMDYYADNLKISLPNDFDLTNIPDMYVGADIIKLTNRDSLSLYEALQDNWDWERPIGILTKDEREFLSAITKPFNVESIIKRKESNNGEYITINTEDDEIMLPCFEDGSMYQNMELGKAYTLEELGIDDDLD